MTAHSEPLLALDGVSRDFASGIGLTARFLNLFGANYQSPIVRAVDTVSLNLAKGEIVGLVGESGCGKSTAGRMAAGLLEPSSGTVRIKGRAITAGRQPLAVQMIFQDPFSSLNPRKRVAALVGEAVKVHHIVPPAGIDDYADSLLARCGIDPSFKRRYPHQFSGGQRQRICIARALAVKPEALICDEAVSALDVSIQAQILNLFLDLRDELGLAYLFISHDLGVIEHVSDRVLVMYLGRIVESAPAAGLFRSANHPYTRALLAEAPRLSRRAQAYSGVQGELPSPLNPPSGCHFHPRCPAAMPLCREERPALREISPGHFSACHLNSQL